MALMQQGRGGSSQRDSDEEDEDRSESEDEEDEEEDEDVKPDLKSDMNDGGIDSNEEDIKPRHTDKLVSPTPPKPVDTKPEPTLSRIKLLRPAPSTPSKPTLKSTFPSLGISPRLLSSLKTISISRPTEIQAACIEPILQGRDVVGLAKTGSGKTMAFALPILERILRDPFGVWAVVLTPTR